MSNYAVEIENLTKKFDGFKLGPLNFNIPKGTVVGFIGQNGAGKSTTIKLILGLLNKDSGKIEVLGEQDTRSIKHKDKIGVVFDDLFFPEEMDLRSIERLCSSIYSNWESERFSNFKNKFNLTEKQEIKKYSRGMKMKLSIAIALSHNAELLILDEATSGLDPVVREEILEILYNFMQKEEHTILISSHILSDLEKIADYIAFINEGKILFFESKEDLKEEYAICTLSNEDADKLDESIIVGRRKHSFGQEILIKRKFAPRDLKIQRPSIEDIMIYFVKGA